MIVADVLVKALKKEGINCIFGYPGGEVTHFIEAARQAGIRFILTKHENAAAFMAGAYGEITGKPGVCVATLGPGATNMATGVADAYLDRAPMIAITGNMSTTICEYATHQKMDVVDFYKTITKWSAAVEPQSAVQIIAKAIKIAKTGKPGPVHLNLPSNIAAMEVEDRDWIKAPDAAPATFSGDVKKIVRDIEKAQRPIILAGLGVVKAHAHNELVKMSEKLNIPVVTTPKAKGIIPEDHPLSAGVIEMLGDKVIIEMIESADLILAIGYDVVELDKQWTCHHIPTVHIDLEPNLDQFYPSYADMYGDIKQILQALDTEVNAAVKWDTSEISQYKQKLYKLIKKPSSGMTPLDVVETARRIMPRDTIATCDVGAHKMMVGQMWKAYKPREFFMSNGLSAMGYGFPTALGAKLVYPERPVVAIIGDGGFGMTMAEIETAVREKLPIIVIVMDDETLTLIRMNQERKKFEVPAHGVVFKNPDIKALAESFGAFGAKAETVSELEQALKQAMESKKPALIQAVIDPMPYRI